MDNKNQGSPVADSVLAANQYERHRGVMQLRGYLDPPPAGTNPRRRLFTDDSFTSWIEFDNDDLLHHIPGGADPCCPMGAVWIKSEAVVLAVNTGLAYIVAEAASGGGPTPPWRGPTPPFGGPTPPFGGPTPPFG